MSGLGNSIPVWSLFRKDLAAGEVIRVQGTFVYIWEARAVLPFLIVKLLSLKVYVSHCFPCAKIPDKSNLRMEGRVYLGSWRSYTLSW